MNILGTTPGKEQPGNPDYFNGHVTLRPLGTAEDDLGAAKLIRVEFAPQARTNWHTHTGVQLLVVLEGFCRFQHWGGAVEEVGAGATIYIPAGEKHWHGASPDQPMTHLAINLDLETNWLEEVSEEQYAP
jgi:quercetin dioxygenase-like cupin family protein